MDNKNILALGSLLADFNQGAAYKAGQFVQEKLINQDKAETTDAEAAEAEAVELVCDFDAAYQEHCNVLGNIKEKWDINDIDNNLQNKCYMRDLLYLYDRISLDMKYFSIDKEHAEERLQKLLELKYEIRNLF